MRCGINPPAWTMSSRNAGIGVELTVAPPFSLSLASDASSDAVAPSSSWRDVAAYEHRQPEVDRVAVEQAGEGDGHHAGPPKSPAPGVPARATTRCRSCAPATTRRPAAPAPRIQGARPPGSAAQARRCRASCTGRAPWRRCRCRRRSARCCPCRRADPSTPPDPDAAPAREVEARHRKSAVSHARSPAGPPVALDGRCGDGGGRRQPDPARCGAHATLEVAGGGRRPPAHSRQTGTGRSRRRHRRPWAATGAGIQQDGQRYPRPGPLPGLTRDAGATSQASAPAAIRRPRSTRAASAGRRASRRCRRRCRRCRSAAPCRSSMATGIGRAVRRGHLRRAMRPRRSGAAR